MTNFALRGAGMAVAEQTQFCVSCRELGHACAAQNGIDQCVFCEDGEPCPVTAAAARKAATAPAPAIVKAKPKPAAKKPAAEKKDAASAARSHLEQNGAQRENPVAQAVEVSTWLKQRDAYREQRKAARAEKQKEKAMDGIKCKRAECQTLTKTDHGYCPKHFYLSIAKNPALVGRKCSTGCGGNIRADNKSGICKSCVKAGVKKPSSDQSSSAKNRSRQTTAKPNGHTAPAAKSEGIATIVVTESALDRWWSALGCAGKALAFTQVMGAEN